MIIELPKNRPNSKRRAVNTSNIIFMEVMNNPLTNGYALLIWVNDNDSDPYEVCFENEQEANNLFNQIMEAASKS